MEIWVYNQLDDSRVIVKAAGDEATIGRDASCSVTLAGAFVSRRHGRIFRQEGHYYIERLGLNAMTVRNEELREGARMRLAYGDEIAIGQYRLYMMDPTGRAGRGKQVRSLPRKRAMDLERRIHGRLLERLNLRSAGSAGRDDAGYVALIKQTLEELLGEFADQIDGEIAGHLVREFLWRQCLTEITRRCTGAMVYAYGFEDSDILDPAGEEAIVKLIGRLLGDIPLSDSPGMLSQHSSKLEKNFDRRLAKYAADLDAALKGYIVNRMLHKEIEDVVLGYGPLQDLLDMPNVSEIMVVGRDHIYLEKDGVVQDSGRSFFNDETVQNIIERIITPVGRRLDRSSPLVDARLPDGSRVNAIVSPLSLSGPVLTIRKFARIPFTIDDFVERGTLTPRAAEFLRGCVAARSNMVISGGTGSGKTTTLNVLGAFISPDERIVTIEDSAELQLPQEHLVRLETRPANIEGRGAYTIRDLVRNALRMRPDRLIVGECRGPEALDMLQAMNTGHDGSLTTIHANNPADTMLRLETMVLMAVEMPIRAIREQIVAALDLVVQISRMGDGARRITHITEVTGIDPRTGGILTEDIFRMMPDARGKQHLKHTGYMPSFAERLIGEGFVDLEVFCG